MGIQQATVLGGVNLLDHYETILYTADNVFPRSFSTTVDARLGLSWFKNRTTGGTGVNNTHRLIVPTDLVTPAYDHCPLSNNNPASNTTILINETSIVLDSNAIPASYVNTQTPNNYVLWLFKRLAGFMDVVTYTGDATNRLVPHGLGIAPGFMLVKDTNTVAGWVAWHRSMTSNAYRFPFDSPTGNETLDATAWNSTAPDASNISLGTSSLTNRSGGLFTAFVFGHDTSPNGRVQCFSYTGNALANGPIVTLGWQPRYIMVKRRNSNSVWMIFDTTRTPGLIGPDAVLNNGDGQETAAADWLTMTADGFQVIDTGSTLNTSGNIYLGVAIR